VTGGYCRSAVTEEMGGTGAHLCPPVPTRLKCDARPGPGGPYGPPAVSGPNFHPCLSLRIEAARAASPSGDSSLEAKATAVGPPLSRFPSGQALGAQSSGACLRASATTPWRERYVFGLKRRRKSAAPAEKVGVFVGSVVGAQFASPSAEAQEDAAIAAFDRAMSPGLRQPGPIRHHSPFTSKPGRQGTGL
jgi:hypothetical protein